MTFPKAFVALLSFWALCPALVAKKAPSFTEGCSVFDRRGDVVTATMKNGLLWLRIAGPGGTAASLPAVPVGSNPVGCQAFIDRSGSLVAIGISRADTAKGDLRIITAGISTGKRMGDFVVKPGSTMGAPLALVGFLGNSSSLVVLGSDYAVGRRSKKQFATQIFRPSGGSAGCSQLRRLPADSAFLANPAMADAAHNRLWFLSRPQFCPMRSIPLTGAGAEGARVEKDWGKDACDFPNAVASPDSHTLMTAMTREPGDLVTRVDLEQRHATQIRLPQTGGRGSYTEVVNGLLTPDGQVFAVAREMLSLDFFGQEVDHGTEVDLMQVKPLRLIGKFRFDRSLAPGSLSVDHRGGVVTVLGYWKHGWRRAYLHAGF